MNINDSKTYLKADIEAVITSYNQGSMILEAVQSVCNQTLLPKRIIIVDDGSTDKYSLDVLNSIKNNSDFPIPVTIHFQENKGVSASRNTGINKTQSSMVLVLDGDDKLEAGYIENVSRLLCDNPQMVIASSWMRTFGVLDAVVCPAGGKLVSFLSHNCCPATHILCRKFFEQCGGYDESMRSGFEDWDFFLNMLETIPEACIGIVEKPLINYRTAPSSANIKSMDKRLELMRYIIGKHNSSYVNNVTNVLLDIESVSDSRLLGWENEMIHAIKNHQELSESANDFIKNPSYGDGGMASAVRIASIDMDKSETKQLETERLILRRWRETDAESLYEYAKSPKVGPVAGWPAHTSIENSREIIRTVFAADETYAVCLKENNIAIGCAAITVGAESNLKLPETEGEIGYWIGVPFWGQGLIPEAVRELIRRGFEELHLQKLWCGYFEGNTKSKRVQEKCGFIYHHTNKDMHWELMDDIRTEHVTCLTREEWEKNSREKVIDQ